MKNIYLFILIIIPATLISQSARDYAVEMEAEITPEEKILLRWKPDPSADNYLLYKKLKEELFWTTFIGTLNSTDSFYLDSAVEKGVEYEYRMIKNSSYTGYGYISSGIEVAPEEYRGRILVLIDSTHKNVLDTALEVLKEDLIGDGWNPHFRYISRDDSVAIIKNIIETVYNEHEDLEALFLIGHVPVPYSGDIAPDGHVNNHRGAWPADIFYGVFSNGWTDYMVDNTSASGDRNDNIPGDGKYDQAIIPDDNMLQTGRVDFHSLTNFIESEGELLRKYLERNHNYRMKNFTATYRGVIDDNFGGFSGEAFASNGWRNFAPLLGLSSTDAGDYRTQLNSGSRIWSYGCGGGSYTNCGGVGNSADISGDSLQTIFTMLFGSYFGDWDVKNNLMRTALAQGTTLTISWAGRPHWMFHHMGMGENIGYSARLSQNNSNTYWGNYGARFVHPALLGDPTLRMYMISPPADLEANLEGPVASLTWTPSEDTVSGYYVYRSRTLEGPYNRMSNEIITIPAYSDSCLIYAGEYYYNVRAIRLETTPSGSFYNLSQGALLRVDVLDSFVIDSDFTYNIQNDSIHFLNTSINANEFLWDFGDGNQSNEEEPVYSWDEAGIYEVMLIASNECASDTSSYTVNFMPSSSDDLLSREVKLYPNPARDFCIVQFPENFNGKITLMDITGREMKEFILTDTVLFELKINDLVPGVYSLHIKDKKGSEGVKMIIVE